jgi:hypothetical protein
MSAPKEKGKEKKKKAWCKAVAIIERYSVPSVEYR